MRRFKVWIDCDHAASDGHEDIVEMPDNATDEECDAECHDALDALLGNHYDTGWNEITEKAEDEKHTS